MLIRTGPGVNDVFIGFEALIGTNIPKLAIIFFDNGNDVFARLRGHCPENVPAAIVEHHAAGLRHVAIRTAGGVAVNRLYFEWQLAFNLQMFDGKLGTEATIPPQSAISALRGKQNADPNNVHA